MTQPSETFCDDRGYVEDESGAEFAKWICETKRAYTSIEKARESAVKSVSLSGIKRLCIYRCAACKLFHLTKKKTRILGAIKEQP